jgi:hypothetical protein
MQKILKPRRQPRLQHRKVMHMQSTPTEAKPQGASIPGGFLFCAHEGCRELIGWPGFPKNPTNAMCHQHRVEANVLPKWNQPVPEHSCPKCSGLLVWNKAETSRYRTCWIVCFMCRAKFKGYADLRKALEVAA